MKPKLTLDDLKQTFFRPKHDAGHPTRNNRPRMMPRGGGKVFLRHTDPVRLESMPHGELIPNPVTSGIRNVHDADGRRIGYEYA